MAPTVEPHWNELELVKTTIKRGKEKNLIVIIMFIYIYTRVENGNRTTKRGEIKQFLPLFYLYFYSFCFPFFLLLLTELPLFFLWW